MHAAGLITCSPAWAWQLQAGMGKKGGCRLPTSPCNAGHMLVEATGWLVEALAAAGGAAATTNLDGTHVKKRGAVMLQLTTHSLQGQPQATQRGMQPPSQSRP